MSALVDRARRLLGRSADLAERVTGLEAAVAAAGPHLDAPVLGEAEAVLARVGERLRLAGGHTVVALAGATGSGKSSVFNALCGTEVARVGIRRPTTSHVTACVWGDDDAGDLLAWLGVPQRHRVVAEDGPSDLDGLVLLDLPDHDSTETAHHREVDRLTALTDMWVWVLDPQKYADAALHERYLRPLSRHAPVMVAVLNQVDRVAADRLEEMVADLRRLLADDGLPDVPVFTTSATTGAGLAEVRAEIARRVAANESTRVRLVADVIDLAERLDEVTGRADAPGPSRARREELVSALSDAAGVPVVVHAVARATRTRGRAATGWPLTSWIRRLRPDPLRRLHLDLGGGGSDLVGNTRSSLPAASQVQQARVDAAVRRLVEEVAEPLTPAWVAAVRRASLSRTDDVGDALDRAVTQADLGMGRLPVWVRGVRALQWTLITVALLGALWLGAVFGLAYLQIPPPETPSYRGVPIPTLMLLGALLAGFALAVLSRMLVGLSARLQARRVERRLHAGVANVADLVVLAPIEATLTAYDATRAGLRTAVR